MKGNRSLRGAAKLPLPRLRLAVGLALAGLAVAGPAGALASGTVEYYPPDPFFPTPFMAFTADSGDANRLIVSVSGATHDVTISDANNVIFLTGDPATCTGNGTKTVKCPGPGIPLSVQLGDAGSTIAFANALDSQPSVNGGAGDDTMIGGPGPESLRGGGGNDTIKGNGGDDDLSGGGDNAVDDIDAGPGADSLTLTTNDGADKLRGGGGSDALVALGGTVGGPGGSYTLDDGLPNDGFAGQNATVVEIEDIQTGEGADSVRGTADANVITTNDSNDVVDGLAGSDLISTGTQDDTIEARDGFADRISCGPGIDTARIDQLDEVTGCESAPVTFVQPAGTTPLASPPAVTPPAAEAPLGVTPPALDRTPPVCTTRAPTRVRGRAAIIVSLACNEPSTFELTLSSAVRGRPVIAGVGDLVLTQRSLTRAATGRASLTIPRRLRAALGRRAKLKLQVQATDASGNRGVTVKTISFRSR